MTNFSYIYLHTIGSSNIQPKMTSFFLLISLSVALAFFRHSQGDLIGDICSKSVNPTLCNSSLRSDPRTRGADLRTLAKIVVDQSIAATGVTVKVAASLASGPNKPKATTCVNTCNAAIGVLNGVRSSLAGGGGGGNLPTQVSAAFSDINLCDSQFGRDEPPQLKAASFRAQGLVNVLFVIVNSL